MVDRRYSQVVRTIWEHPKFQQLSAPKPNAQTLVFRLLVAPESSPVPGLFKMWDAAIAKALNWPLPAFRRCLTEAIDGDWVKYDDKTCVWWVTGAIDQDANQPANPNVVRSWRTTFAELPESSLKMEAIAKFRAWAQAKGEAWEMALEEALGTRQPSPSPNPSGKTRPKEEPKPLVGSLPKTSPIQEKEKEQEKEQEPGDNTTGSLPDRLFQFEREPGGEPSPRKDPLFQRISATRWFPSQQIIDWYRELGVADKDFDRALIEFRNKTTGAHDFEWLDARAISFIAQKAKKRPDESAHQPYVSP